MACHSRGESLGGSVPSADAAASKLHPMMDLPPEWRSREQLEPSPPSTSPAYWDTDEDDDSNSSCMTGPKPTDLYGKFTWKIENFSEISKRELRSNVFEVGGYKWYILVYPQGCDVCNHLSLFLCVADYDKLLPGWSHFAQFTIAVVNKDPKKSKYSDTLHRFCKKEHDWGWKKFMELSKVLDGFTVADTLVIKAQVQVIRENPHRPFRCLDCQYRRELVRVYLTNVEGICRRFVEEKREKLGKLMEDTARWNSFQAFWSAVEEGTRRRLAREKTDVILKAVVKRFFNEKEVTSTLVMDALYSGCKSLDYRSRSKNGKVSGVDVEEAINPIVWVEKDVFVLAGDVLLLLERVVSETLPHYKDDKGPQNRTKLQDGSSGDDFGKDSVERDERRLTELGRRTVEMFVLAHLYTNRVEVAYREAVALKRQEELIREEEAAGLAETELRAKREAAEKEKRSKKKQAKQRRKDRKDKDKEAEEKRARVEQENRQRQSESSRPKERMSKGRGIISLVPADAGEVDHLSGLDATDDVVGTLGLAGEDCDVDHTTWERDASYGHSGMEAAGFSGAHEESSARNGRAARKNQASALDDSSSTCSSDSLPSVRPSMNGGTYSMRPGLSDQNHAVLTRARSRGDSDGYEQDGRFLEADGTIMRATALDPSGPGEASSSCSSAGVDNETVILSLRERVRWLEQRLCEKDEEVVMLQEQVSLFQHQMRLDRPSSHISLPEEASVGSRPSGASSAPSSSPADESSSGFSSATPDVEKLTGQQIRSSKTTASTNNANDHSPIFSGNGTAAGGAVYNGDNNSKWFLPFAGNNVDSSSRHGLNSAEVEVGTPRPSASAKTRCIEVSRPPRVGMPPSSSGASLAAGVEETSSSYSATFSATLPVISRPASAPGLVPPQRPGSLGPILQAQPPLSRSVSAAGRLVLGAGSSVGAHCNGNTHISPPVSPSYRNAAAGRIKSLGGLALHPVASSGGVHGGVSPSVSGAATSAVLFNTPATPSASHASAPSVCSAAPTASASSPPLTPSKMRIGSMQGTQSGRTEAAASPSAAPVALQSPVISQGLPESLSNDLLLQEYSCSQSVASGRRSPAGITFGTVTPEVLHQQQEEEGDEGEQERAQPRQKDERAHPQFQTLPLLKQESMELHKQENLIFQEGLSRHHSYRQQAHQRPVHSSLLHENGVLSGERHSMISLMESVNNGGVMAEDFPHLDIINDFSQSVILVCQDHPGMLKHNQYGQLPSDSNAVNSDGSDRGRTSDDERMHMHEGNTANIRENRRMSVAFCHQPLGRLQSQHSGHLDSMAPHYWPITSAGISAGNNVRNGLDSRMSYSLVQSHHVSVQDCSGFALGHNGYSVYAPGQQP
ncbi:uncharacterized protein [Physcomitrium patens]|uniref:uncharacterized protein n=1 Tax=Physcomitrium patens TaxID=3218 RepID=UPI000D1563B1|nr:TNF receptor-associated factor homolog 1a-like [Physcomitrium patens]|eukprot:XP_024401226.1 TNF receptor-associated factor homolog 1a-like [Physcomitrella patens]